MKIITVSREFGSGGRELGKRLADYLGVACYDHEIIDMVAEEHGFDKNYISHVSEKDIRVFYPSTVGHRFASFQANYHQPLKVISAEHEIIRQIASREDCVIVGRCADVVLRDMNPMNIFVYADKLSKLSRCVERADENEKLGEKEILKQMKRIDRERAAYRGLFTESEWGRKESYHLCVNTSDIQIKQIVPSVAHFAEAWFDKG